MNKTKKLRPQGAPSTSSVSLKCSKPKLGGPSKQQKIKKRQTQPLLKGVSSLPEFIQMPQGPPQGPPEGPPGGPPEGPPGGPPGETPRGPQEVSQDKGAPGGPPEGPPGGPPGVEETEKKAFWKGKKKQ